MGKCNSLNERFIAFWDKYGTPMVSGGVATASITFIIDTVKRIKEHRN
jgi:hypothetical protein